jgi:RHS repeat-associated protein
MRQGDVVYYLHGDHLGSTSLTTDQSGVPVAETRYLPYGEERWTSGGAVSGYTFTGQRAERGFGLMDYRARYYDPKLGRFVSADTVVPNPTNPQLFNRYSYAGNNPLRYDDPDGHGGPLILAAVANPVTLTGLAVAGFGLYWSYRYSWGPNAAENRQALATAIDNVADRIGDTLGSQFPLGGPSEGWTETMPLGPAADPSYIPGPTLDTPEWPGLPGIPLDSGTDVKSRSLDFPLDQETAQDFVLAASGIYEFPDLLNPGQIYVGQSGNIDKRLKQHERSGRYQPGTATTTSVPGNKLDREIAEQNRITALGGIDGGNVSNERNPVGRNRFQQAIPRGLMPY